MLFQKYEVARSLFYKKILKACQKFNVKIYGSFATGNFHLSNSSLTTYSDLDIIVRNNTQPIEEVKKNISDFIKKNTNIKIEVHARHKRIHHNLLSDHISYIVSGFETLIKIYQHKDLKDYKDYKDYQIAKFLLRTYYKEIYFFTNIYNVKKKKVNLNKLFLKASMTKLYGIPLTHEDKKMMINKIRETDDVLSFFCDQLIYGPKLKNIYIGWHMYKRILEKSGEFDLSNDLSNKLSLLELKDSMIPKSIQKV